LLTSTGGATDASDSAPFMPLDLTQGTSPVVDDPIGARSSLGLTLWHMGHDADQIRGFHEFLRKHDVQPESLVPAGVKLPNTVSRILIEPERLPADQMNGKNWKHFMVDLVPGDYILRLSHVTRLWHAGKAAAGYADRAIDLLYFTDEIWEDVPSDATLQTLRDAGAPADLQMSAQPALDARGEEQRRLWQVRPLSWEDSLTQPRVFALSREYWRQQIDALGKRDYGTEVPDYRVPERQIVFDDDWNLVANPVQIRRRIDALNSDILTRPSPHVSYWLQAGDFQKFEAEWARYGTGMIATYGDFNGSASTDFPVDQPGEYTVWAHFRLLNAYYAPWRVTATNPAGEKLSWDHDAKEYPSEWQKIGVLKMDRAGIVHFEIEPLGFQNPGTYRIIHDFLLTTDADYVPQGDVRPP